MDFSLQPIRRDIVIEGFNSIYYFEFGKDFSHPPERHDFWEMVYADMGDILTVTDGVGQTLHQGQALFHRPMEKHAHVSDRVAPNNMLVVSFTTHSPAMEFFDKKIFTLDKTAKTLLTLFIKEARHALSAIPGDYTDKNALDFSRAPFGSTQLLECYLTEFLLVLRRGQEQSAAPVRDVVPREVAQNSVTELIANYLRDNVYATLTLGDLCNRFFIGKSRLCQMFKDYMGKGPIEYFSELKMAEAKKLLLDGQYSVSRISDMLGYSSIHNFSRAFKKAVGFAPTEYRNKINRT